MTDPSALPPDELVARLQALERAARPLEPGATRRRRLRGPVLAHAERFLRSIANLPAFHETEDNAAGLLDFPISEGGAPIAEVLEVLEREVERPGLNPASGGHLAYIPGGGLYHAALGDYLAAVANKYAGVFFTGPGPVRMENQLLRWMADLVGYPAGAGGNLASGGSIANLIAVVTARDAHGLKGADFARTVVYLTHQAHHCVDKALRVAGLGETIRRYLPTDDRYRMQPELLARAIAEDRASGLRPWLVIASAGTTDVGAVDPLDAIATVAERERCWLHVDAAYGGFFLLTEQGRTLLAGIERSDSVVMDPHKGLFLPYGLGVVLVRDRAPLLAAHHYQANYMQDAARHASEVSPADVSPELTKHFRALRLWLPLKLVGVAPFRAALEEKLLLARYFHRRIQEAGFEVGPRPELSVVTYRYVPKRYREDPDAHLDAINAANQRIVDAVRRDGRVFLSSTMLEGRFTLRLVTLAFRTHRRTVDLALEILAEQAGALEC
ncbi:MAG: aspartate aminotransferase family protein [Gemmatimonadales bacterium]